MPGHRDAISVDRDAARLGVRSGSRAGVSLELQVGEQHLNFLGVTHGGVLFSLAACALRLVAGERQAIVDAHLALTGSSGPGDVLAAAVEEVTRGKTLASYRVKVTRGDGRTVGVLTATTRTRS